MIGQEVKNRLEALATTFPAITEKLYEFKHVQLTDEEFVQAVYEGMRQKDSREKMAEYNRSIRERMNWGRPNSGELYYGLKETKSANGERFKVTEWNKNIVIALCRYFAGEKEFEKLGEGFSLEKGIMLMGKPGVGKSHLMNFFYKNPHASYANVTCTSIAERYRTGWTRDEQDTLQYYSFCAKAEAGHPWEQIVLGYCFGDLGTEGEKKNFGNSMNVMENIIFQRYENHLPFNMTHFTTNLNAKEIEDIYGLRVRDRLKEMCNVLTLEGPSFR